MRAQRTSGRRCATGAPSTGAWCPASWSTRAFEGEDRIVRFANGVVVREVLVDLDDDARRLVWSVADGPYTHHNASAQVFADEAGRTRFVWIADLLPNDLAGRISQLMDQGTRVIKHTMEAQAGGASEPHPSSD